MCLLVGLRRFALYVYAQLTRVYLLLTQPFFFCLPARQQRESSWFLYLSLQPRRRGKKNSRNRSPNDSPTQRCTK